MTHSSDTPDTVSKTINDANSAAYSNTHTMPKLSTSKPSSSLLPAVAQHRPSIIGGRQMHLQLKQLETVWQAVNHGFNLSQAAQSLHTSQSSLSKHISSLEDQLRAPLFVRQGKRLVGMTPLGEALLPHIEKIFAEIRTIQHISEDLLDPAQGTLTIATTHTQARYVLPSIVTQFRTLYPKVQLILIQSDPEGIADMVTQGQADIGIATESLLQSSHLRCHRYYDWSHCVILPNNHPLAMPHTDGAQHSSDQPDADHNAISLTDLVAYPIITYHGGFTGRSQIDRTFAKAGLYPDIVLAALDADVISTYVAAGLGIGIIAEMAFEASHYPNLVSRPIADFGRFTTWIATRDDAELRQFGQAFIRLCQTQFDQLDDHIKARK